MVMFGRKVIDTWGMYLLDQTSQAMTIYDKGGNDIEISCESKLTRIRNKSKETQINGIFIAI